MTRYKSPTALHSLNEMRIAPCWLELHRGNVRTLTVYQLEAGLAELRHRLGRRDKNSLAMFCRIASRPRGTERTISDFKQF
jgi:hypothetical protein